MIIKNDGSKITIDEIRSLPCVEKNIEYNNNLPPFKVDWYSNDPYLAYEVCESDGWIRIAEGNIIKTWGDRVYFAKQPT